MMLPRTLHVVPLENGWTVQKVGKKPGRVFRTQKEAIAAARKISGRTLAGCVVVHLTEGRFRLEEEHGFPKVQRPPRKSRLGTKAIERAVSKVLRDELASVSA